MELRGLGYEEVHWPIAIFKHIPISFYLQIRLLHHFTVCSSIVQLHMTNSYKCACKCILLRGFGIKPTPFALFTWITFLINNFIHFSWNFFINRYPSNSIMLQFERVEFNFLPVDRYISLWHEIFWKCHIISIVYMTIKNKTNLRFTFQ